MAHSSGQTSLGVGSVIAGTYAIEGLIGKGGMGAVFLASHARLPGKKVAIKILHAEIADTESLARFRREVHAQTYHLIAQGGLVLRSQTIFEHKA